MSQPPKISIITISYNAEKFIERTIKSIIEQTYQNIEYIIVDGSSKDGTLDIIQKYGDNISKWISEPDENLYDAMNKGINLATGDYIWIMNAGDCINTSATLSEVMELSNGEDFIYGDTQIVQENGEAREWHKKKPKENKISAKSFINGMVICHQSMIVKREKVAKYSLNRKVSADLEWTIETLKKCNTFKDTGKIICRYLDDGLSANNRWKAVWERFIICKKHFGLLPTFFEQFKIIWGIIQRKGKLA